MKPAERVLTFFCRCIFGLHFSSLLISKSAAFSLLPSRIQTRIPICRTRFDLVSIVTGGKGQNNPSQHNLRDCRPNTEDTTKSNLPVRHERRSTSTAPFLKSRFDNNNNNNSIRNKKPPSMKKGRFFKKKNNNKKKHDPLIVGPDYIQVLQGRLFNKSVALILCGESHEDAIDVTRKGGKFQPKEGWMEVLGKNNNDGSKNRDNDPVKSGGSSGITSTLVNRKIHPINNNNKNNNSDVNFDDDYDDIAYRIIAESKKQLPLEKSKEWGEKYLEEQFFGDEPFGCHGSGGLTELVLIWAQQMPNTAKVPKGKAFLVEIGSKVDIVEYFGDDDDDDNDDEDDGSNSYETDDTDSNSDSDDDSVLDWFYASKTETSIVSIADLLFKEKNTKEKNNNNNNQQKDAATMAAATMAAAAIVREWIATYYGYDRNTADSDTNNNNNNKSYNYRVFEWGDLDKEAFVLNKRRLTDTEIPSKVLDSIIHKRKEDRRRSDNIWLWDDWFSHIRNNNNNNSGSSGSSSSGGGANTVAAKKPSSKNTSAASSSTTTSSAGPTADVHLVFEGSVPPWELQLHRPGAAAATELRFPPAADCIRCVEEDEEEPIEDECDPSADGVGSYIDYVYRRFTDEMLDEQQQKQSPLPQQKTKEGQEQRGGNEEEEALIRMTKSTWMHCVDTRDLGCQTVCASDKVKEKWKDLLLPDEIQTLFGDGCKNEEVDRNNGRKEWLKKKRIPGGEDTVWEVDRTKKFVKFLPASIMNPELAELDKLKRDGTLIITTKNDGLKENNNNNRRNNDDDDDDDSDEAEYSFPSFEGFFGQNTDFLYYTPHVKLTYAPFLGKCLGSLRNWESFFTRMFLGGTISDALSSLLTTTSQQQHNNNNRQYFHVRSPIRKHWNSKKKCYEYRCRDGDDGGDTDDDGIDHYITYPFFNDVFYLFAKDDHNNNDNINIGIQQEEQRTWSSQLFFSLLSAKPPTTTTEEDSSGGGGGVRGSSTSTMTPGDLAVAAKEWTLESIGKHSRDPKGTDDPHCGGEWFEAYLRAVHRDIYDDIDLSDATVLLRKNYVKSISGDGPQQKYNIGKIRIPTAEEGFEEIAEHRFSTTTADNDTNNNNNNNNNNDEDHCTITPRVEVMAKIIIDIWMSNLIDFSTVLKIAQVVALPSSPASSAVLSTPLSSKDVDNHNNNHDDDDNKNVIVVCYMGSAHTRVVAEFYVHRMKFQKKAFVGKLDWDTDHDNEPRTLKLPSFLWNTSGLFQ